MFLQFVLQALNEKLKVSAERLILILILQFSAISNLNPWGNNSRQTHKNAN
jgi:hypothetical protein